MALSQLSYGPKDSLSTGLTGFEPATSGVTDRHSNQAELQPPVMRCGKTPTSIISAQILPPNGAYWTRTSDLYDVNVAL